MYKAIIIKDKYSVSGSDMAQIGWVEVATEDGTNGYLWYLKSESETRLRFEDSLEMAMVEAEKKGAAGVVAVEGSELACPTRAVATTEVINSQSHPYNGSGAIHDPSSCVAVAS